MTSTATIEAPRRTVRVTDTARPPLALRDWLHRAAQRADEDFCKRVDTDLTPRQWCLLAMVAHNEGCSQTALCELTGIDRSTLADIVKRMHKKGLLQRKRTREDARTYAVKLSDEGSRILRSVGPVSRESDRGVLSVLTVTEQRTFLGLLERVAKG